VWFWASPGSRTVGSVSGYFLCRVVTGGQPRHRSGLSKVAESTTDPVMGTEVPIPDMDL